jgi:hypothetical protein
LQTLNEVYSSLSMRRRYEVWFVRLGLADGSGAWWFRYLLMNPGRGGCPGNPSGMPLQVWATWFPSEGKPQSFIQGFPFQHLELSSRRQSPFHFRIADNAIDEGSCRGALDVDGHKMSWNLQYRSTFRFTMSDKGWIGFSRTPHSDAIFSGQITLDGRIFSGDPLGFGLQGHNCGYRHRNLWTWTHAYFGHPGTSARNASTFEALIYEMPFGLMFRKAVLRHEGEQHVFRDLQEATRDRANLLWNFQCANRDGLTVEAALDGRGPSVHRLPYLKTDCSGSFEVANNSRAKAVVCLHQQNGAVQTLETESGAVLEMAG